MSPTRMFPGQTSNILDLVLTASPTDIDKLQCSLPIGRSDHCTISFHWSGCASINDSGRPRRNYWRTNQPTLQEAAAQTDWSIPSHLELEDAWTLFRSKLELLVEEHVPISRKRTFTKGPPWFDGELRLLLKSRRKLWDRFKLSQSPVDYDRYKIVRNRCTQMKRKKRTEYELRLAETSKTSPKLLFAYLKRRTKAGSGIPTLRSPGSEDLLLQDAEKAESLGSQYASVYTVEPQILDSHIPVPDSGFHHLVFERENVMKALLELRPDSSPGPDEMHPAFLRTIVEHIAEPVRHILQLSLETGRLPVDWKIGTVKPIFKGGARHDPTNYRPICLTSIVCKVMEKLLKRALQNHLNELDVLTAAQHGFQKGRSCVSNLLVAREKWVAAVDAGLV
ncbi:uncharacterized protein LOC133150090 [Syngnathus typhle]|uniref:uncharacterized protein LOC133150090 n=1 Tax=Syngnathus typhle TaxID=161592 RepID=UPI002A6B7434|nr:uncharacterized protein LOC133150090 [Syngnathus typhle]